LAGLDRLASSKEAFEFARNYCGPPLPDLVVKAVLCSAAPPFAIFKKRPLPLTWLVEEERCDVASTGLLRMLLSNDYWF
jgi:hypothetical protein